MRIEVVPIENQHSPVQWQRQIGLSRIIPRRNVHLGGILIVQRRRCLVAGIVEVKRVRHFFQLQIRPKGIKRVEHSELPIGRHANDLLTAVFGGFFIGAGIGLAMRGGAVLDGTDIAALLISKKIQVFRVGDVILGLNVVIFLAAVRVLGTDPALYSILTYFAASKTLDFILHGLEEYTAITVISERSDEIRLAITGGMGRGVTVYKGRGGRSGADQEILFSS